MSDVRTVKIKFKDLVFLEDNPRTIKKESLERLAKRIQDDPAFFEARPCLVNFMDGKYICYGGFQRGHAAAKILKWKEVPCSVENDVPTDVMRRRAILDNTHDGEWDSDVLANQWSDFSMEELGEMGVPDWVFGGDDEGEIPNNALNSEAQEDDFEPPEIETVKTDIVLGDLFEIGKHRLLCGDSTKAEDVERLMGGGKADMVLTDPPYGVSYVGGTDEKLSIENDSLSESETHALWGGALSALWPSLKDGGAIYATVPPGPLHIGFATEMHRRGALRQILLWNKSSMVLGHSDYHYKHEPILYGWKPGAAHYFTPDRTKTTVLDFDKPQRNGEHPTMKPIALWAEMMGNSSKPNQTVVDPFSGSGTTMVTAHQLKRVARCCEIDPKYCQVIVLRMLKLDPTLEIKKNGQPYKSPNVADLA